MAYEQDSSEGKKFESQGCASKNNMIGQPSTGTPVSKNAESDNDSVRHNRSWFDRHEGNIIGKNEPATFKVGKRQHVVQNVGKTIE